MQNEIIWFLDLWITTRYTFWKFSTYYISLIYVSIEVLTQRVSFWEQNKTVIFTDSLTYLWLKRNFWLNHDHWSSVCPLPFFCLTHSEGQVREVGSKKKSTKLIVPRLGVLRFVTQPYTEPNVTPSHHQVVSTWYGLYGQDHVFTGELQLNVNFCRPNHYCRGIIGPAQTKIGKYTSFFPTIYFEFAIHLQQQFTCTWEVLRSLYVLHTYILDKQGRYKW